MGSNDHSNYQNNKNNREKLVGRYFPRMLNMTLKFMFQCFKFFVCYSCLVVGLRRYLDAGLVILLFEATIYLLSFKISGHIYYKHNVL
jgi:hypothetical protein